MNKNQNSKQNQKINLNLNLKSNLSLKALEGKALRAAKIAEFKAKEAKDEKKPVKKTKKKQIPLIDREINSIHKGLIPQRADNLPDIVMLEWLSGGAGCRATISIYDAETLASLEDAGTLLAMAGNPDGKSNSKLKKVPPTIRYAFYPATLHPDRLGSVAIYCKDPRAVQKRIIGSGTLFGHAVVRATIEIGRRPFVDVTLAA